ncbi:unnamed protein product [Triticum turgidum subsp. durum]|uniref:Uncharacterized protein n=1 Tax=Triticum turgidum subsp. durum TaxID=4567 RepID=A0A9R0UWA6_TRITD|nr:unnamed protein product [Triticum turgidum subsp. durum]
MPSSPAEEDHPSSRPSPEAVTPEVPEASDRAQVESKEVQLSDMLAITLDDTHVQIMVLRYLETKKDIEEVCTYKKISECFESIVPEPDNQIDRDPLQSPPSPSNLTLSHVFSLHDVKEPDSHKEIKVDETYDYLPQGSSIG